jgi:hypothetical protein
VRGRHGRYEPIGALAAAGPMEASAAEPKPAAA